MEENTDSVQVETITNDSARVEEESEGVLVQHPPMTETATGQILDEQVVAESSVPDVVEVIEVVEKEASQVKELEASTNLKEQEEVAAKGNEGADDAPSIFEQEEQAIVVPESKGEEVTLPKINENESSTIPVSEPIEAKASSSVVATAPIVEKKPSLMKRMSQVAASLLPPSSPISTKQEKKDINPEVTSLLVSLHIPLEDAKVYSADLFEHGFENLGLFQLIEKEDLEEIGTVKKLAHRKAILKWIASGGLTTTTTTTTTTTAAAVPITTTNAPTPAPVATPSTSAVSTPTSTPVVTETPSSQKEPETPTSPKESITASSPEAPKKKVFSMKASPNCAHCGKAVYKTEETSNSKGTIFHKECLRCQVCKTSLAGKEPVSTQTGPVRIAQYRIQEGTGHFLCDKHAVSHAAVVQGASKDTKARRVSEIARVEAETHERNLQVKDSMQYSVGDLTPVCSRCGFALEKNQEIIVSGLERFHAACPTAEEAAKIQRSVRFFVKKVPERIAMTFFVDKEKKQPHTFLYEIDKDSVNEAMKLKKHEKAVIQVKPDSTAHASLKRKLMLPSGPGRDYDFNIRDMEGYTFEDVKSRKTVESASGSMLKPMLNKAEKILEVSKTKLQNGVLHTMMARFSYDEAAVLIEPICIQITLEMYPPVDESNSLQDDPLTAIRGQLRETRGESLVINSVDSSRPKSVVKASTIIDTKKTIPVADSTIATKKNKKTVATPTVAASTTKLLNPTDEIQFESKLSDILNEDHLPDHAKTKVDLVPEMEDAAASLNWNVGGYSSSGFGIGVGPSIRTEYPSSSKKAQGGGVLGKLFGKR